MASQKSPDRLARPRAAPRSRCGQVSIHQDNGSNASLEFLLETKCPKYFASQPKKTFPETLRGCTSAGRKLQVKMIVEGLALAASTFPVTEWCEVAFAYDVLGDELDPENKEYNNKQALDGAEPPKLPEGFKNSVNDAIQASHEFLTEVNDDANEIPTMTPDICIVNLNNNNRKLGLHQDKDETDRSFRKGLPVVSFSLGDSAELLYGNERNLDTANRVVLE